MSRFKKYIFFLLIICCQNLLAQIDNSGLEADFEHDSLKKNKLTFRFSTLHFVKNNEYFNNMADGYTLWGYQLNPQLVYKPSDKVMLSGGMFLQQDFGQTGFTQVLPTFTIKINHNNWNYLLGTLDGSISHRLIEPLYNFERLLNRRIENGLQIRKLTSKRFFDFWISYPKTTGPGQDQQEEFWGGVSSESQLFENKSLTIRWPVQFTGFHLGGQNLATPQPVRSAFHLGTGLSFNWELQHKFLERVELKPYFLVFNEAADQNLNGWAFYPSLSLNSRHLSLSTSFWYGHNFTADYGGDLFQAVSRKYGNLAYTEKKRSLLIMRLIKNIKVISKLNVSIRFEPYFDFGNNQFQHSEGVYLSYWY